ncbi:DUF410 domain-containing protein [Chloropicon primus]|uniref:Golgi to ER traffic protein 4 n=2 Tax=Chloropicon primus TaxID=1764295 RepID=A0A5B8MLW9_9CHLO|nr:hypothetical protein A3770_04p31730 [Chloropicon primus]UPQ99867.1 DUF410 domain-containing protein [Chloropicon primus]|eukprot:QDZ20655.1 hypothetical protein A3770_04p31730 [Chloropicon primus]
MPVDRIAKKLQDCVEREDYYQAQQLCLSLYSRHKRKDAARAFDVLVSGVKLLFPRGDVTAASELALTLSRGYLEAKVEFSPGNLSRIHDILDAYPEDGGKAGAQSFEKFVEQAAKWCYGHDRGTEAKVFFEKLGRYTLRCIGDEYAGKALLHSMRGNNLSDIVTVMTTTASRARPDEEDYIIARVVLRFLNFRSRSLADLQAYARVGTALIDMYEKQTGRAVPETPVTHFLRLTLEALTISSAGLVAGLREKYSLALGQDPALVREADQVLATLKPRKAKMPDLSQMFKTLLG